MAAEEDSLVRVSPDKLPGHALGLSMQKVWEVIREQKDLNLPAHKVVHGSNVATSTAGLQMHAHMCANAILHGLYGMRHVHVTSHSVRASAASHDTNLQTFRLLE